VSVMLRSMVPGALVALLAFTAEAQQGRGGFGAQRCAGCDSTAMAAARMRSRDSEIADRTVQLAEYRIMVEHLRSRLAEGSPEAPRNDRERAELEAKLVVESRRMQQVQRELSALCGESNAVQGYIGVDIQIKTQEEEKTGKMTLVSEYPLVTRVEPGSPAARAGIAANDTIISINRQDARGKGFDPFVREPGERLVIGIGRADGRRDVTVTTAQKPATFGGACLQYRNLVFMSPTGQSVVTMRSPGATGAGGTISGTVRARPATGAVGSGGRSEGQQVRVQLGPDSAMQGATFIFTTPPGAIATGLFIPRGATGAIVAGAEVALVNGGLKTMFAVDYGALVVNVAPRSPADQAGILSGDVIVTAQGAAVTAIPVIQRAIQAAGERRSVTLEIVRAKQAKTITLRW
jgi:C-terminal processing protease CtpA/Prc